MKSIVMPLLLLITPAIAAGQTASPPSRWSVNASGGTTLNGGGYDVAGAVGFAPASRVELLVNVERIHLPFEREEFTDGYGLTRGGTLTFVSGEVRLALFPPDRVSPFLMAGAGGGISRPNVNADFPTVVRNNLRLAYVGGGVRVPLARGLGLIADVRGMLAIEDNDGVLGLLPVRAGISWRF